MADLPNRSAGETGHIADHNAIATWLNSAGYDEGQQILGHVGFPGGTTAYLRGDGQWSVPAGGGSGGLVTVKDYGALGNNSANDSTAFQNAMNANALVYVPPGIYRVRNLIPNPSQRFVGLGGKSAHETPTVAGAKTAVLSPVAAGDVMIDAGNPAGSVQQIGPAFEFITFWGNGMATVTGFRSRNINRCAFSFCTFRDLDVGMSFDWSTNDSAWHNIFGCNYYQNNTSILVPANYGGTVVGGDMIMTPTQVGIRLGAQGPSGGATQHWRVMGMKFDGGGPTIYCAGGGNEFSDCSFENSVTAITLRKDSTNNLSGKGNYINGCVFNQGAGSGMLGIDIGSGCDRNVVMAAMYIGTAGNLTNNGTNTTILAPRS